MRRNGRDDAFRFPFCLVDYRKYAVILSYAAEFHSVVAHVRYIHISVTNIKLETSRIIPFKKICVIKIMQIIIKNEDLLCIYMTIAIRKVSHFARPDEEKICISIISYVN